MSIRAIILDFGGVLIHNHDGAARHQWERRLGLTPGALEKLVFENPAAAEATVGRATEYHVWRFVCQNLGLNEADCAQLQQDFWKGDAINTTLVTYVHRLRPRYKTAILSNAWPMLRYYLTEQFRIAYAFDTIVVSAEEGLAKPDPCIYLRAVERLGVQPQEAVFVDDMAKNIAAARTCGLYAIQYESTEQVLKALDELLALENRFVPTGEAPSHS